MTFMFVSVAPLKDIVTVPLVGSVSVGSISMLIPPGTVVPLIRLVGASTSRSRTCASNVFANDVVTIIVLTKRTMINTFVSIGIVRCMSYILLMVSKLFKQSKHNLFRQKVDGFFL